jgi:hypothetical protein
VLQPTFDHFVTQPVSVLADGRAGHEMMLVQSVGIDLAPNVFVEDRKPIVRHAFDIHNQSLTNLSVTNYGAKALILR